MVSNCYTASIMAQYMYVHKQLLPKKPNFIHVVSFIVPQVELNDP